MVVRFNYSAKRKEVQIESDFIDNIRAAFSVKNKAAFFQRGKSFVAQRVHAITDSGFCGIGLVPCIVQHLETLNIPFKIEYNNEFTQVVNSLPFPYRSKINTNLIPREYQQQAIDVALQYGYGVIELATGGGKTLIMANLAINMMANLTDMLGQKILIVVPDVGLAQQTHDDFINYGISPDIICKWTGTSELDPYKRIIIANMGILQSKNSDLTWFKYIGAVIVDECHKLRRGNKVCKVIDKIPTFHKFGFTGTLPPDKIDEWNIYNYVGPLIYSLNSTGLREISGNQFIANARALSIVLNYDRVPEYDTVTSMFKYKLELDFIKTSEFRNNTITKIINSCKNNSLVLVDHIDHGEALFNSISKLENKKVYFIQGSVEVEDRKKIQDLMEKENNIVCVAISKIFSTGISIKNIHFIMFAAGGKSKIKVLQSIGRGLRIHKSKDALTIIDITDNLLYGKSHYSKRKEFYDTEKISIISKEIYEKAQ